MMKSESFSEIDLEIAQRVYRRNVKPLSISASTRSGFKVSLEGHHAAVLIEYTPLPTQNTVLADVAVSWRYRWCCPHAASTDEARCYIEDSVKYISCAYYHLNPDADFSRFVCLSCFIVLPSDLLDSCIQDSHYFSSEDSNCEINAIHALDQYDKNTLVTQDIRYHAKQLQSSKKEVETSGGEGLQSARKFTFLTDDGVCVRSPGLQFFRYNHLS